MGSTAHYSGINLAEKHRNPPRTRVTARWRADARTGTAASVAPMGAGSDRPARSLVGVVLERVRSSASYSTGASVVGVVLDRRVGRV